MQCMNQKKDEQIVLCKEFKTRLFSIIAYFYLKNLNQI